MLPRIIKALLLAGFVLLPAFSHPGRGQTMDASPAGGPVSLSAPWRFHFGDDPAWAAPDFNDSGWALHSMTTNWASANAGKPISGFAWYRMRVTLPKIAQPLAMAVYPGVGHINQEIYVDGTLVATIGHIRPSPKWVYTRDVYAVSIPSAFYGRSVVIAVRAWVAPLTASLEVAGAAPSPAIGNAEDVQRIVDTAWDALWLGFVPLGVLDVVAVVVGLFSLGLFILQRESHEYGWAALYLIGTAGWDVLGQWLVQSGAGVHLGAQIMFSLLSALLGVWLLFTWGFVHARKDRLLYTLLASCLIGPVATAMVMLGQIRVSTAYAFYAAMDLILAVGISARLLPLARKGNRDAQLFLVPFFLSIGMNCVISIFSALGWAGIVDPTNWIVLHRFPLFELRWEQIFSLLSYLAVGAVLVLRFTRAAQQEQRLTTEMEAARRVQAQLVPAQLPKLAHFGFDAAYRAASEVGGDFYQVYPRRDDSALILVGDVSGKGLKAAMLGTVIIGAAAALAQENLGPAELLSRLNQCLNGRADGGFATCVCGLVTPAGVLTLANAGHLPPYRNGVEIPSDSGLPLGILPDSQYTEVSVQLAPGAALTFISDGVVEARSPEGELFGFERARQISSHSARQIAETAAQFGQEDDITVLSISFPMAAALA